MRRTALAAMAVVALVAGACGGGGEGAATRRVLVDYSSDEVATFALLNFPAKVTVRQGDVVEFKQTWTGEPHTVTGGTSVTETIRDGSAWIDFFDAFEAANDAGIELPDPEDPGAATAGDFARAVHGSKDEAATALADAWERLVALDVGLAPLDDASSQPFSEVVTTVETESEAFFATLPSAFDDDDQLAQNVSQPCYRKTGGPPEDAKTPCKGADRKQPEFDGRQSYYNSGVIPYEGERGNSFRVKVAEDAKPGSYLFYCAIHGFGQKSEVTIVDAEAEIPSQSEVNRAIRAETKQVTSALEATYRDAADDLKLSAPGGDGVLEGPFAGLPSEEHAAINEFVPKELTVGAGEPITWKMMGADHSISFGVPRYFPIMEFLDGGTVRINPKLDAAAGGATPYVEPEDGGGDDPPTHDGGTYDGSGFWSSGVVSAEPYLAYTMRISKPGTYAYACLLHPRMVGRIKVT